MKVGSEFKYGKIEGCVANKLWTFYCVVDPVITNETLRGLLLFHHSTTITTVSLHITLLALGKSQGFNTKVISHGKIIIQEDYSYS